MEISVQGNTVAVAGAASAQGTSGGSIAIAFDNSYVDTADTLLTVAASQVSGGSISVTGGNNATLTASAAYIADGNAARSKPLAAAISRSPAPAANPAAAAATISALESVP